MVLLLANVQLMGFSERFEAPRALASNRDIVIDHRDENSKG